MVGGVANSSGSTAYLKGAQLGSGSSAPARKPAPEQSDKDTAPVSFVREKDTVSARAVQETKEARVPAKTELQAKNDESTLRTEQARGSLLDIAV